MNLLDELIRAEIRARGPMRFDQFMDQALYHREYGYYATPRRIGRAGDFYTSVSVSPLFGRMLAWQAEQMADLLGEPEFWIVEQGAHDGQLAFDILAEARCRPEFYRRLKYLIIEPNGALRRAQEQNLKEFSERVHWVESLVDWKGEASSGLFFSNELADALPVRLIQAKDGDWRERCVGLNPASELTWVLTAADAELRRAIDSLPLVPAEGFCTEIALAARSWMKEAGKFLRRGYMVTVDYGFPAATYYAPFRRDGTLACYRGHRRGGDVLSVPGTQDITAHVDFTALAKAGEEAGLETLALVDQGHLLTGILKGIVGAGDPPKFAAADAKAFMTLTHPEHLGERFKVLVQARDAPANLSGLHFARGRQLD